MGDRRQPIIISTQILLPCILLQIGFKFRIVCALFFGGSHVKRLSGYTFLCSHCWLAKQDNNSCSLNLNITHWLNQMWSLQRSGCESWHILSKMAFKSKTSVSQKTQVRSINVWWIEEISSRSHYYCFVRERSQLFIPFFTTWLARTF